MEQGSLLIKTWGGEKLSGGALKISVGMYWISVKGALCGHVQAGHVSNLSGAFFLIKKRNKL